MEARVLVIVGPTASGKTDMGIRLAKQFDGEVICVDSRTVYRGMDIGTAKPIGEWSTPVQNKLTTDLRKFLKEQERCLLVEGVTHWGVDLVDPNEDYSISEFKAYADKKIAEIVERGKLPILVGGTGLWIDAIVDNLSLPEVPPDFALREELEAQTANELFEQFEKLDPAGALEIDRFNKRRLIRALEVCIKSGKPFSQMKSVGPAKYDVVKIGMDVDREVLRERIDTRVDAMIANGFVDEVRKLKVQFGGDFPAMTGIGYRQINFFLDGKANLAMAIEDTKKESWAYAKRQLTWFKRDTRTRWISDVRAIHELPSDGSRTAPTPILQPEYFSWIQDQLNLPSLSSQVQ